MPYGALVLSTSKIRQGSWAYCAEQVGHGACEYFLGLGEAPGRWAGHGLEPLGLEPNSIVTDQQLEVCGPPVFGPSHV
jgi:hypothetical protein